MPALISGKIKRYPSGLSSVIFSLKENVIQSNTEEVQGYPTPYVDFETGEHVRDDALKGGQWYVWPGGGTAPPWQLCQSSASERRLRSNANALAQEQTAERSEALRPGHGGLGNKECASWKSCREARERMAASEMEYGTSNGLLLTVTLPSVDENAFEGLARYSSWAMDRLNRELNRYFGKRRFSRISVWEYQKRGALHAHIYLASESLKREKVSRFTDRFLLVWYRVLKSLGDRFPCNPLLRKDGKTWKLSQLRRVKNRKKECVFVNCQRVRKSVVAYLSQYLSDSHDKDGVEPKNKLRKKFYPIATWFQWNRDATSNYKKHMVEVELGDSYIDHLPMLEGMLSRAKKSLKSFVQLAKDTKIMPCKKPYNKGFYWIPEGGAKNKDNESYIRGLQEVLSPFFKEEISPVKGEQKEDEEMSFGREYSGCVDRFTMTYYHCSDILAGEQAKDWADCLFYLGVSMLDFFRKKEYDLGERELPIFTTKTGEQLCIFTEKKSLPQEPP